MMFLMLTKIFIIVVLLVILYSLGSALYYLVKKDDQPDRVVKALTLRITLSVALFIFLLVGFATGILKPHGLNPNPVETKPTKY